MKVGEREARMVSFLLGALAAATPAVTLAEARAMPPAIAGERLLAGQPHGPIVAMREAPRGSLPTPGTVELQLDEQAERIGRGCGFRRWTAIFRQAQGTATTLLQSVYPGWRVAVATSAGCGGLSYAHVNPSIAPEKAIEALATIKALARRRPRSIAVTCRSEIRSSLCDDARTLLRRVVAKNAWLVTDGGARVLYGVPGQVPASVTLIGDPVTSVEVRETIPPPS